MAQARIQFSRRELAALAFGMVIALFVALLTIIAEHSAHDLLPGLFYPLMPGLVVSLMITGGHGGTALQERSAAVLAPLMNGVVYLCLFLMIHLLWRRLTSTDAEAKARKDRP